MTTGLDLSAGAREARHAPRIPRFTPGGSAVGARHGGASGRASGAAPAPDPGPRPAAAPTPSAADVAGARGRARARPGRLAHVAAGGAGCRTTPGAATAPVRGRPGLRA